MIASFAPKSRLWIWFAWLAAFYATWTWLVFAHPGRWEDVRAHWPIALAMTAGSYVAGSTPMGGGTVGFPILVLLFGLPAKLGRDFSFAVQSIGMVSASLLIIARGQPLAWSMLRGAMVGALGALPIGIVFLTPWIAEVWIKIVFAVVWGSFGVLHLYRIDEIASQTGMLESSAGWDFGVGVLVGAVAAATVTSVTGVGIDMVLYATLVLLCRSDLKIAIPTSVVIMAFTSVLGVVVKAVTGGMQAGVYENWLAAAPIVALGAPLGVFVVTLLGRKPTLRFVSVLCVGQFLWTAYAERVRLGTWGLLASIVAIGICLLGFEALRAAGARRAAAGVARHGAAQPTISASAGTLG